MSSSLPGKRMKVHMGGKSRRRYQREWARAPEHECDICKGRHVEVRRSHAYHLMQVRKQEYKGVSSVHGFWYNELLEFERRIDEINDYHRRRDAIFASQKRVGIHRMRWKK